MFEFLSKIAEKFVSLATTIVVSLGIVSIIPQETISQLPPSSISASISEGASLYVGSDFINEFDKQKQAEEVNRTEQLRVEIEKQAAIIEKLEEQEKSEELRRLQELRVQEELQRELSVQEQIKMKQGEKERINSQIEALLNEYYQKINDIDAQILAINQKYYKDIENLRLEGISASGIEGRKAELAREANRQIELLQLSKESLRIEYLNKISALDKNI